MNEIFLSEEIKKKMFSKAYNELALSGKINKLCDEKSKKLNLSMMSMKKPRIIALLAILLGNFGAHRFYIGDYIKGAIYIIATIVLTIIGVLIGEEGNPVAIVWIVALIEGNLLARRISQENYIKIKELL